MYRALKKQGLFQRALYAAQENTKEALAEMIEKGLPYNQAWELVREEWLLLPSEEDVPMLGNDPARWEPPPVSEEAESFLASGSVCEQRGPQPPGRGLGEHRGQPEDPRHDP
jgi:hypothetical protein